jgi:drug/metabolite transporter (DMT)-like permease
LNTQALKSDVLLLLTAIIWGFAFVAQRAGMSYVGPFIFNAVRFTLGSLVLLPLILWNQKNQIINTKKNLPHVSFEMLVLGGGLAGFALFSVASLQQVGLVYTTAGKAGFITGLYVVIVPILGLFCRQRTNSGT